ncbi:MAG: hypothetical protein V1724_03860 [Chloroflexota bacterium]
MNAEQAKLRNIVVMAFGFSAMTRVFEKKSTEAIVNKLSETLPQTTLLKTKKEFENLHDGFCRWFEQTVRTADRKKDGKTIKKSHLASYGQGAKVLDVALKVYVYYCHLPEKEKAKRTEEWLNAAIDTKMMKYLKETYPEALIKATAIEDVDEKTYADLQKLVHTNIEHRFPSGTLPVQWDDVMWRKLNKV